MSFSAFLDLQGVVGGSQDPDYRNQIEVLSFSFGNKKTDMNIVKIVDIASTILFQKCAMGDVIPSGTLTVVKQEDKTPYLK